MEVERIELINSLNDYNRLIHNMGYLSPLLFRDIELLKDFYNLKEDGFKTMECYKILSVKYRLAEFTVRLLIIKFRKKIEKPTN